MSGPELGARPPSGDVPRPRSDRLPRTRWRGARQGGAAPSSGRPGRRPGRPRRGRHEPRGSGPARVRLVSLDGRPIGRYGARRRAGRSRGPAPRRPPRPPARGDGALARKNARPKRPRRRRSPSPRALRTDGCSDTPGTARGHGRSRSARLPPEFSGVDGRSPVRRNRSIGRPNGPRAPALRRRSGLSRERRGGGASYRGSPPGRTDPEGSSCAIPAGSPRPLGRRAWGRGARPPKVSATLRSDRHHGVVGDGLTRPIGPTNRPWATPPTPGVLLRSTCRPAEPRTAEDAGAREGAETVLRAGSAWEGPRIGGP
jgi:hypothetical protein